MTFTNTYIKFNFKSHCYIPKKTINTIANIFYDIRTDIVFNKFKSLYQPFN